MTEGTRGRVVMEMKYDPTAGPRRYQTEFVVFKKTA
jgi:hypothetical protein